MEEFYKGFLYNHELLNNVKSESAKVYLGIIDMITLNYKAVYPIGKKEIIVKSSMDDKTNDDFNYSMDHVYYCSIYNISFTALELFLHRFLIEKLNNTTIRSRKELESYLKNKYGYEYISFQNLYYVNTYYKRELKINLKRYNGFKFLSDKLLQLRHDSTHNLGLINGKEFIYMNELKLEILLPTQMALVRYIDDYF
ncbi:hypothetical protein [Tissierella creatinophila]|uniref:RiboL-PSP-HEPN domain-containing protein n=1 Tax=Tissierella creatinophila DSM 6911 TaxID=1123403 RepID=A0A1U7M4W5_TISCR|nr:hypothetical protein [Tissierella creatinophila]OLS02259.1 hypothetical protein TICRE_16450 [Tissierella creatinophila DSM 6911]